jgi:flagellar basal body-associated protein FliL
MENDRAMDDMVKKLNTGRGRRVTIMVLAVLAVAVLIGVVVAGFRGRHISQNAAAMTTPVPASVNLGHRPRWLP